MFANKAWLFVPIFTIGCAHASPASRASAEPVSRSGQAGAASGQAIGGPHTALLLTPKTEMRELDRRLTVIEDDPEFVQDLDDLVEDTPDTESLPPEGGLAAPSLSSDVPLVYNARVQKIINYFQGRGRDRFEMWLGRSGAYVPMMQAILAEEGLPSDLVYLALIESGFSPYAHSSASAVGFWQFIAPTGKRYGLRIDEWVDERRNPEKATRAAARYLKDLYDLFGDWHLAAAGYNAGENKIARAIRMYDTTSYWELIEYRYIKPETKDYVPKLIAAITIAKNPQSYSFNPVYLSPASYTTVLVPGGEDLRKLAYAADVTYTALKRMNTELKRWMTPPGADYELRIPQEAAAAFGQRLAAVPEEAISPFKRVTLGKNDSLEKVAGLHKVSVADLLLANPAYKARAGAEISVPVGEDGTRFADAPPKPRYKTRAVVKVKHGDTLRSIAKRYRVSETLLAEYNGLQGSGLKAGQRLNIPAKAGVASAKPKKARAKSVAAAKKRR